jgi:nitrite reductase/ring-hydroxylating ferredoxin subunit
MEQPLLAVHEIPDEGAKTIDFFGREVLVYKVNGTPRASANVCLHLGGPLEHCGSHFRCAWHGATFDVDSGQRLSGPAGQGSHLMNLPTKVVDGVLTYIWAD